MSAISDLKNNLSVVQTIVPVTSAGNITGVEVDTLGFNSATLVASAGLLTTGTIKLQETNTSGSGYTDVASDDLILLSEQVADDALAASSTVTIGYAGTMRYLRAVFTQSVAGPICATIELGHPQVGPTDANG